MRNGLALVLALAMGANASAQANRPYGLGLPATAAQIAGWNIDISPDGAGLPPGQGSVEQGQPLFASTCAACHGAQGQGKPADTLAGGFGTLKSAKPLRTVGSYWPYATTLFDYIRRAMPFNAPESLTPDQVYAATAYVLYLNRIVPEGTVLNQGTLAAVMMPNRNGFFSAGPDQNP